MERPNASENDLSDRFLDSMWACAKSLDPNFGIQNAQIKEIKTEPEGDLAERRFSYYGVSVSEGMGTQTEMGVIEQWITPLTARDLQHVFYARQPLLSRQYRKLRSLRHQDGLRLVVEWDYNIAGHEPVLRSAHTMCIETAAGDTVWGLDLRNPMKVSREKTPNYTMEEDRILNLDILDEMDADRINKILSALGWRDNQIDFCNCTGPPQEH